MYIEKLVFGGQAIGRDENGKVIFVWNALPGEDVEIDIIKKKKDFTDALATHIITPSADRIVPKDAHFLSSAAWQMMTFEAENKWKQAIAAEAYSKIADMIIAPDQIEIITDGVQEGYRNKMEYSFAALPDGTISLALFARGQHERMPVTGSSIAAPLLDSTAQSILQWVNEQHIPLRSLKSIIIRTNTNNEAIAALFIKDELPFDSYPALTETLKGFQLYYSTHKSPASVPTKLLYSIGQDYLTQDILGTTLTFGLLSFFQVNIPMFILALKDIAAFLDPTAPLIDLYSGVGAIGLPLSKSRIETIAVEENEEAVRYCNQNILQNNITNATAHCTPAEKILDTIHADKQIIVDPPRAGLHESVIKELLKKGPPKIIYLSCNISTQARDMRMLSSRYAVSFMKLYNFFPRTPHIEGLVVLEKIV